MHTLLGEGMGMGMEMVQFPGCMVSIAEGSLGPKRARLLWLSRRLNSEMFFRLWYFLLICSALLLKCFDSVCKSHLRLPLPLPLPPSCPSLFYFTV